MVLVTGAAGFIGSHVSGALLARGQRVIGLDNFDGFYDRALKERNVAEVRAGGAELFQLVEGDIRDEGLVRRVFEEHRPAGVIHLAARAGVRPSIADPVGYVDVNVRGTMVVLEAARRAGCGRAVVASSSSVYGNCPVAPFSEEMDVSAPISPYAATKKACELIGHTHWHLTGMPTAMLRFFTVYGARQRPDLAIGLFLRKVAAGETIPVFGDGTSSRDYTYIDDIVAGVLAAYDRVPGFGYRVWNLGGSEPVSLARMIEVIGKVVRKTPRVERKSMQPGDVERTSADLARAGKELGYSPRTGFEEGVRKQWEWVKGTPPHFQQATLVEGPIGFFRL
ncbi:MAG: GDP-mannose 4,6-dehydratase [Phycisphaerales bacterium]|nr:GDP-mannose 4,6-dehydratase [Phycisphaerales bacterium]